MTADPFNLLLRTAASALLGLAAGWLVNYLADVLPTRRRLAAPFCRSCGAPLKLDVYLAWMRACPACGAVRGLRAWIVILGSVIGFVWIGVNPPQRLGILGGWFWFIYLFLVVVIDVEHRLILHKVAAFGAVAAGITGVILHGWVSTLIGGAASALIMLVFYILGVGYSR